jgi:hypothetical protein
MPRRWFKLKPTDMSVFDTALGCYSDTFDIQLPAERVWAQLTSENPLAWCRLLQRVEWTSPRPFGVGTTRTAKAFGGALALHEEFIHWDEGHRKAFVVREASLPLFTRFGEDYTVEPTGEASCRFTWTIAADPQPLMRPGAAVNGVIARSLFRDTRRHFQRSS